jgi:biopolymer transport protein ExbD
VDLPRASVQPQQVKPETLRLSVQADGSYALDGSAISDDALADRLQRAAAQSPPPELHLSGDKNVRYERVAQAMATAQRAGIRKIGFVTEPTP